MLSSPDRMPSDVAPLRLIASNRNDIAIIESHANCGGQMLLALWNGPAKSSISLLYLLDAGTAWPTTPSVACTYTPSAAAPDGVRYSGDASAAVIISGMPVLAAAHCLVITTGGAPVAQTSRRSGLAAWIFAIWGAELVCEVSNVSSSTSVRP